MAIWNTIGKGIGTAARTGVNGVKAVRSAAGRLVKGGARRAAEQVSEKGPADRDKEGKAQQGAGGRRRRRPRYTYLEPSAAELLNQQAIWSRLEQGEKPGEAIGPSSIVLRSQHVPRITVIIAVYEPVLRYFEATLISVLSQTYGGYELIVADMSLSGGVRDLVSRYRDSRIRYSVGAEASG